MKTDQLIDILSSNIEPVKGERLRKGLVLAVVVGGIGAFCMMLGTVGLRPNGPPQLGYLALRLVFTFSLIILAAMLLARLARPGQSAGKLLKLTFIPFVVIVAAGVTAIGFQGPMAWGKMMFGMNWITCFVCIPLFAVVPFLALTWFL